MRRKLSRLDLPAAILSKLTAKNLNFVHDLFSKPQWQLIDMVIIICYNYTRIVINTNYSTY